MNKSQLVESVANATDMPKAYVEKVINVLTEVIVTAVKNDDKVALASLGTFEKVERKARIGVNPATGAKIKIEAKSVPKFKFAKSFKDQVAA